MRTRKLTGKTSYLFPADQPVVVLVGGMNNQEIARISSGASDPSIKCYLLGAPFLEQDGQPITILRRQTRALLFFLAANPQPIQRGKICFIFWPDVSETNARRNLSRLLNQLKNTFVPNPVLKQSHDVLDWQSDGFWTDISEFRSAAQRGDHLIAIALYRGTFLEGFALPNCPEFEHWARGEADSLERMYLECLEGAMQAHAKQRHFKEAINLAHSYLKIDELAEPIHRRLIEFYAASGDRAAAIKQFEECLLILERELGVDALPETKAVLQAVLSEKPANFVQTPAVKTNPAQPSSEMPFVGREDILGVLANAFEKTVSNQGSVILITGEAGIGKTLLLQNFADAVRSRATILQAGADPSTQNLPYQLITQALRSGLESRSLPKIQQLSRISESARLLPELKSIYPRLPSLLPIDLEGAQLRLFDALAQFALSWIKPNYPVLLCLDDLHWADATSLQWLAYFGTQIHSQPILIIGTCRTDERSVLDELIIGLSRQGILSFVEMEGLKLEEVERALESFDFPWGRNPQLIIHLWQISAGNPFFVKETIRGLIESRHDWSGWDTRENLHIPETILQAVKSRLKLLSEISQQVLDAAAVIGPIFSFEIIRETSGRREEETGIALDDLVTRGLLVEEGTEYRFQHEIIQLTVYSTLTNWRRRLLHHRVAQAMLDLDPHNYVRLSWHFEQGEALHQAAAASIQAGANIKHIFAYTEALNYFNHALELLQTESEQLQRTDDQTDIWRLRIQALAERGWVFRLLGDMVAYEQDLHLEAKLVEKLGDKSEQGFLYVREAALQRWWCRYDLALDAAYKGLSLNQEVKDTLLEARCLREVGLAYREKGDFLQAQDPLEKALEHFDDLDDLIMLIHTLGNLSTLFGHQGDFSRAMGYAQRALEICDQQNLIYERRLPLGDCGAATAGLGNFAQARDWLLESLEITHQIDDRTQEIFCLAHLGWIALQQDQADLAFQQLTAALNLAEKINSYAEQSRLRISLAQTYIAKGERQKAASQAEMALRLATSQGRGLEGRIAKNLLTRINKNA